MRLRALAEGGGTSCSSATESQTISGGGSSQTASQTVYYTLSPFDPVGAIDAAGSPYSLTTNFTPLAATVAVGQTGAFDTIAAYQGSLMGTLEATQVNTFSVLADTPTTLQLCTTAVTTAVTGNADGITSGTEVDCYRIDANGNMSLYSIQMSTPYGTVTFK